MKVVVAAFNQERALVGAFSVITNLRMELFEALILPTISELFSLDGTMKRILFICIESQTVEVTSWLIRSTASPVPVPLKGRNYFLAKQNNQLTN